MVRKRSVLELIAARTRDGKPTSYRTLVRELDLSPEAACSHLGRLWRERLIRCPDRPPEYRFQLKAGESLRELRFAIRSRGLERLERWKETDEKKEGWLW